MHQGTGVGPHRALLSGERRVDRNPHAISECDPAAAPADARESPELQRLRREVEQLRLERDFLKKAAVFFAKDLG